MPPQIIINILGIKHYCYRFKCADTNSELQDVSRWLLITAMKLLPPDVII
jgi:hypothetical protein